MTISMRTVGWNKREKWLKVFVERGEVFLEIDKGTGEEAASFVLTPDEWREFRSQVEVVISCDVAGREGGDLDVRIVS